MLIQSIFQFELPVAQITLPTKAVKRAICGRILDGLFLTPRNLLVGDGPIYINLTNQAEDSFAIKLWSARAGTALKMVSHTSGRCVPDLTERTGDVGAAVGI